MSYWSTYWNIGCDFNFAQNKATRLPAISRQQVQKLTHPPLSTPALISIPLFSLIYPHKTLNHIPYPPPPTL